MKSRLSSLITTFCIIEHLTKRNEFRIWNVRGTLRTKCKRHSFDFWLISSFWIHSYNCASSSLYRVIALFSVFMKNESIFIYSNPTWKVEDFEEKERFSLEYEQIWLEIDLSVNDKGQDFFFVSEGSNWNNCY